MSATTRHTFDKSERLCSTKIISGLFENGNIFYNSMFKVVWAESPVPLPHPAQVAFSIPKRGFRLAVTRNLIRRRIREAYRKQKHILYTHLEKSGLQLVLVIIMKGNQIPDYASAEKSVSDVIARLTAFTGTREQ